MFEKIAIWYLRKQKRSVLIGYEISNGNVKALNNHAFLYDNTLNDVEYRTSDNYPMSIPNRKFNVTRISK